LVDLIESHVGWWEEGPEYAAGVERADGVATIAMAGEEEQQRGDLKWKRVFVWDTDRARRTRWVV
jgi:hypothetical protein